MQTDTREAISLELPIFEGKGLNLGEASIETRTQPRETKVTGSPIRNFDLFRLYLDLNLNIYYI